MTLGALEQDILLLQPTSAMRPFSMGTAASGVCVADPVDQVAVGD